MLKYTSCARSAASDLVRMRRKKNVCRAARCSANSRSTKDGFGSAAAMVTHEIPSHLVYESPRSEMATKICAGSNFAGPATSHDTRHSDLRVSKSRPEDSLSMSRTIQREFDRRFTCATKKLS